MSQRAVVSCGFSSGRGNYYRHHLERLELSLDKYGTGEKRLTWRNSWPPLSPSHGKLHYAFKFYAVQEARRQGCRYVMWLDAGCCAVANIEPLWKLVEEHGALLLMGAGPLGIWVSDKALNHFGMSREESFKINLAGGCLIGIDFESEKGKRFYDEWEFLTKKTDLFWCSHTGEAHVNGVLKSVPLSDGDHSQIISTDPRVLGHRSDEACFSILIPRMGLKTVNLTEFQRYMKTYGQDLAVVDNHSVWLDAVGNGPVLDAGARGFRFAEHFARRGNRVVMMDPSPEGGEMPSHMAEGGHVFLRKALIGKGHARYAKLRMTDDPEARNIIQPGQSGDPDVECMDIEEVMQATGIRKWDLVKLNVEGSEYGILRSWPGPIAKQIVVSFHEHTPQRRGTPVVDAVMAHLKQWYRIVRHEWDERYCAGFNWWDTVLVERDIL